MIHKILSAKDSMIHKILSATDPMKYPGLINVLMNYSDITKETKEKKESGSMNPSS
jgi:hypothetical protein